MNFCDVLLLLLITKLHNRLLVHGFTFIGVAFGCLFFLVTSQWNSKILTSWSSNYLCKFVRKIIIFTIIWHGSWLLWRCFYPNAISNSTLLYLGSTLFTTNDVQPFFSYHVPIWFSISHYYLYQFSNLI
jgi:hypothetical protein